MKKILIVVVLFFGVVPCLKKGKVSLIGVEKTYADDYGGEENGDNEDPCDPSSAAYSPQVCNATDQCDPTSDYYDDTVCEMQTCNPSSVNYNIDECDAQVCDDNSYGTNADLCEDETCLPDNNINYYIDECDAQTCDPTLDKYDEPECDVETCDSDNVYYEPLVCASWGTICSGMGISWNDSFDPDGTVKKRGRWIFNKSPQWYTTLYIREPDSGLYCHT